MWTLLPTTPTVFGYISAAALSGAFLQSRTFTPSEKSSTTANRNDRYLS